MTTEKQEFASLSPEERQSIIVEKVNATGRVVAATLAQEFGVSEDSIRRDLRDLSEAGLVQRFHGGASRLVTPALDFHRRETVGAGEKQLIGRAAAAAIPEGATLLVDSSTTVIHFLRSLPPTLSVRIITTAVDVAAAALDHPLAEVIMIGGRLGRLTRNATGAGAIEAIRALKADYCILGTCGVDNNLMVRADDFDDAYLKATMIKASNKTLLLATAEKLGQIATYEVAPVSVVSTLFTSNHDNAILKRIEELGVDVELS
ncbi:DeoR/GlpR family transcriptional regulator of sugar metabolism [Phyllobacterium sp. 1468]|uniref:DeoR/GlpR family DNA-binding transcription regulator n=1 Tax=Phyllobacterium sp. 1468 TaxID=2817759 RepID=UPI001AEA6B4F|nr:DeoR/GlpR family DNA-binding transcription regulator [Phyllobacterium sp. 1468]MDR6635410.1 DeoR/GlpR family transcriptional regulator of sugar metabolism [Phyllobacterium sp. 1468]